MIPFWCLMPKGEKIGLKQMDQLPLENFENNRVRAFVLSTYSYCLLLSKIGLLWGECLIMWKGGIFESLINFSWNASLYASTSVFDLEIGNWSWFAKTNQVVAKNDPNMPNLNKKQFLFLFALMLHFYVLLLLCWHKSPKRGRLKGKCALGPFLNILVIKCQHKMI
jgi:hypothetical protein